LLNCSGIIEVDARTRFLNALRQQQVDRTPVACVVTGITCSMMERAGVCWPEAHHTAEKLVTLAESVWRQHRVECIKLPFDMTVESEALGAKIEWGSASRLPSEAGPAYHDPSQVAIPSNFMKRERIPVVLEAITSLRRRYESEVAIVSSIVGPFTLAAKLFGMNEFLPWIIERPADVQSVLEKLTELALRYAIAQVEAGADVILIGEASCSGSLISPLTYRDLIVPYHTRLCHAIQAPTILHICGKSTRHAQYLPETGVTGFSFDENVEIQTVRAALKGKVAMIGYVPAVTVMLDGDSENVRLAARECLANQVDILAPGCSLPPHVPPANIDALVQATRETPDPPYPTTKQGEHRIVLCD
jgi:MtaA/CmuA family methyltransferase